MAGNDDLKELYDLARRAMECQADLGHKEVIFEAKSLGGSGESEFKSSSQNTTSTQQPTLLEDEPGRLEQPEFESLEQHYQAICECTNCSLGGTRTKFVYGVGSPEAKILFIGEAPGRDEDLQGEPFVGRAGKLLDKILTAMGLTRGQVYIANILKCRPPGNRDPQPNEMRVCMPYLREQIRLIKPTVICALGRIAAQGLLETTTPLGKLRNQWHRFEGIPLIVTYHPAALLRFQQYKRPTWEDMQELLKEFERLSK